MVAAVGRGERGEPQNSGSGGAFFDSESSAADTLQLVSAARQQVAELRAHTADVVRLLSGAGASSSSPAPSVLASASAARDAARSADAENRNARLEFLDVRDGKVDAHRGPRSGVVTPVLVANSLTEP